MQQNSATWVQIKSSARRLHLYSPKPLSERVTLIHLYSDANGSICKKYMGWSEAHNKDDPAPHPRTYHLMDSTPVFPSMLSTYPRIDWIVLPAYCPLQNCWHNCDSATTPSTGISPPIFWIFIGSRSFIFFTILELVVTSPPALERWLYWWICSCPSPIYMVTSLLSLVWSITFSILAWMILTSMVLSSPICTTCRRSNTSTSNRHILIHSFYDFLGNSPVVVGFTNILIFMLKCLTKNLSSYQVYFSCKITPMSYHDMLNPDPPFSYLNDYYDVVQPKMYRLILLSGT